jgi:hypothetical protein
MRWIFFTNLKNQRDSIIIKSFIKEYICDIGWSPCINKNIVNKRLYCPNSSVLLQLPIFDNGR